MKIRGLNMKVKRTLKGFNVIKRAKNRLNKGRREPLMQKLKGRLNAAIKK